MKYAVTEKFGKCVALKSAKTLGLQVQLKVALILSFEFILISRAGFTERCSQLYLFLFLTVQKWCEGQQTIKISNFSCSVRLGNLQEK
jgi:hypothetical protein